MKKILHAVFITITIFSSVTISNVHANDYVKVTNSTDAWCECVVFVVNNLFGGGRSPITIDGKYYDWSTAASMATDKYWGNVNVIGSKSMLRYNAGTAKKGDVIIMQSNATVKVWNYKRNAYDVLKGNIGKGAGHIGFVLSANYDNKAGGWYISMQSANWDNDYLVGNGSAWSHNGSFSTVSHCTNVDYSWIFIPNGPAVSFWRLK